MVSRRILLKLSALGTASFAAPQAYSASNVTMTHNTGNPIGSTSPYDLSDNTRNLDYLCLGPSPTYLDRRGVARKSWGGMEGEHNADQQRRMSEFNSFLNSSGFETAVDYAPGIKIVRPTQQVRYLGELYRPKDSALPFVTITFTEDEAKWISNGDNSIRQEMAAPDGGNMMQVKQGDPASRARSLLDVYKDFVRVEDFVEFGDGRDQGLQLQKAFNFALSEGKTLVGRPGWIVGSSQPLSISCRASYEGNGMNIVPIGLQSGSFIKIGGTTVGIGDIHGLRSRVTPSLVGTLTGVQIGDSVGQTSGLDFLKWDIYGYDINLKFSGVNVFILNFVSCAISGATNRNVSYECTSNSGENIRFSGGAISDAHNTSNTAVALFVAPGVSAPDIRLDKLSMSYNDCNGDIATGIVEVTGVHEENRHTREFWRIRNTVGKEKTVFTKIAGTMTPGPLSSGQEPPQGRDAFIVYDGSTSVVVRDVKLGNFRAATGPNQVADYVTKVVKHSGIGGAAYRLQVTGCIDANRDTGIPLDIGPELDLAYLTGPNAFSGFTQNKFQYMSFIAGTDGSGGDTRSRSIVGEGIGGNASYNLKFPMRTGQTVVAKVDCKTVAATSCSFAGGTLLYFTANDFQLGSAELGRAITTPSNTDYVVQFARAKAPPGTAYVILQMIARGLIGEVRFSNERLWIFD